MFFMSALRLSTPFFAFLPFFFWKEGFLRKKSEGSRIHKARQGGPLCLTHRFGLPLSVPSYYLSS